MTPEHLASLGLLNRTFPTDSANSRDRLEDLAASRNYSNRDEITVSPSAMGAVYEDKIKMFFNEHMHEDEEIRYILEGAGYFDVGSCCYFYEKLFIDRFTIGKGKGRREMGEGYA